jgi:regulator of protease activity HflC (stomatin/prohibitin superfamily)
MIYPRARNEDEFERGTRYFKKGVKIFVIIILSLIVLFGSFYTIRAGERGILLTFGKPSANSMNEGLHFKIPIAQEIVKMDVKTQLFEVQKTSSASKDLQTVTTDVALNYYISPESVSEIYKTIGIDYQNKVIAPAVQEVVKSSTAQYTAEEIITKRPEVKTKIDEALIERLKKFNIIVQTISITNFEFSPQFNSAIESKVSQEQASLTAQNKLKQIEFEAQQRITQAKGEAEAIRIQSEAITNKGGQAYIQKIAIDRWDGHLPQVTGGAIPFIDLTIKSMAINSTAS